MTAALPPRFPFYKCILDFASGPLKRVPNQRAEVAGVKRPGYFCDQKPTQFNGDLEALSKCLLGPNLALTYTNLLDVVQKLSVRAGRLKAGTTQVSRSTTFRVPCTYTAVRQSVCVDLRRLSGHSTK